MARPPFFMARRRLIEIEREDVNWEAVRAEYVAGDVGQVALAKKHGVSVYALRKRAGAEGWVAEKAGDRTKASDAGNPVTADVKGAEARGMASEEAGSAGPGAADSEGREVQVARRTRMALLQMLERAAAAIPCDATEIKTTGDGGEVRLLKLRDLTAAYKELAVDLPVEDADGGSRVVIDI